MFTTTTATAPIQFSAISNHKRRSQAVWMEPVNEARFPMAQVQACRISNLVTRTTTMLEKTIWSITSCPGRSRDMQRETAQTKKCQKTVDLLDIHSLLFYYSCFLLFFLQNVSYSKYKARESLLFLSFQDIKYIFYNNGFRGKNKTEKFSRVLRFSNSMW